MLKPIESPCDQKYIKVRVLNFLKIFVSNPTPSTPSRFTHLKIQNHDFSDIISFTITGGESTLLEDYLSNKDYPILPLNWISTLQRTIVVTKENSSVYNLHISEITLGGSVFKSSYSFITPFV
ncbi:hypothetical protein Q2490_17055 [Myroides odoratimimus]|uniref:hypothetical protein n=1 Tax=Myroides odoratimimus TaxID=76832 RepID=UPI0026DF552D|nr:hypothetical protein [Myroides odoratimimus]MDO5858988.1 hypothetical protein [Myroides odoratimimus]